MRAAAVLLLALALLALTQLPASAQQAGWQRQANRVCVDVNREARALSGVLRRQGRAVQDDPGSSRARNALADTIVRGARIGERGDRRLARIRVPASRARAYRAMLEVDRRGLRDVRRVAALLRRELTPIRVLQLQTVGARLGRTVRDFQRRARSLGLPRCAEGPSRIR